MATRTIRIGSLVDAFAYDDVDYDSAAESSEPIRSGLPVDPSDVVRLSDIGGLVAILVESKAGGAYLAALNARRTIDQLNANLILKTQVFS